MGDLKKYDVVIDGRPTTLRLTEADAKKRGITTETKPAEKKPAEKKPAARPDGK